MTDQQTLSTLNSQFSLQEHIQFINGPGDLLMAEINNEQAQSRIALQGGHLVSWEPEGQEPVIWLSDEANYVPGKAIRGGIPVCWPWFGAHPDRRDLPAHGIARTAVWSVIDTGETEQGQTWILLTLPFEETYSDLVPSGVELQLYISIGSMLEMKLSTRNHTSGTMMISQALHTYLAISNTRNIEITGLEQCEFLDTLDDWQRKIEADPISINAEIDRIYQGTKPLCQIEDSGLQRLIRIHTRDSHSTVVWNPWIKKSQRLGDMGENGYERMICVESANIGEHTLHLEAGEEHCLSVQYEIRSL